MTRSTYPPRLAQRRLRSECLEIRAMLSISGSEPPAPYLPPQVNLFSAGGYLSAPAAGEPLQIARDYLKQSAARLGLSAADVASAVLTDRYRSDETGVTHLYFAETLGGLRVANTSLSIHVTDDGRVLNVGSNFVQHLADGPTALAGQLPALGAAEALAAAALQLGIAEGATPRTRSGPQPQSAAASPLGQPPLLTLVDSRISRDDIPAALGYVPTAAGLELAWQMVVRTPDGQHWYDLSIDATSGKVLSTVDWVEHASYQAFAPPIESASDGPRTIEINPADPLASPFGWHDTDGAAGAEFTDTRGNNVQAQEDANNDDVGGFRPDGGAALDFNFPLDLGQDPLAYQSASIANLFYLNNRLHDMHYRYGFTESAGNFQTNVYGRGGVGGDPVIADAQDGSGTNNANFATPPDGTSPRMQQYIFTYTTPRRDSSLDTQVVVHEYGHGVSSRLTGGPANANALVALQSAGMGEGWSDWWALMFTQKPGDLKLGAYPIATYSLGQPQNGVGIRQYPYSFDKNIDPLSLANFNFSSESHAAGTIWCSALWDLNWLLIDKYGFSSQLAAGYSGPGSAGNVLALQLVMDALKLQPANPSFLAGRDAILAADVALTGGANQLEIWTAFARRGMGQSAVDNGASSSSVTAAFDVPVLELHVTSSTPPAGAIVGVPPTDFTIHFSSALVEGSVLAAALKVNTQSATSVTIDDVDTLTFHFASSPVTTEGLQTMTMLDGAVRRQGDNAPLLAFNQTFRFDQLPLAVTSMSPSAGSLVTLPATSVTLHFNEAVDVGSVSPGDLQVSQGIVSDVSIVDANTVAFTLSGVTTEGVLNIHLVAGGVTDVYGNPGLDYSAELTLDADTIAFPRTLTAIAPRGSLVYDAAAPGAINFAGDVDRYTLSLDAGQTLSVLLMPVATLWPQIEFSGAGTMATATSPAAGSRTLLQTVQINTAGLYTIAVGGAAATQGGYTLRVVSNAALEQELPGEFSNDTRSAAQDLDDGMIALGGGASRAAVLGQANLVAGLLPDEIEPNGSLQTANEATSNFADAPPNFYQLELSGNHSAPADLDYFNIGTLHSGDTLTISLAALGAKRGTLGDAQLRLYRGTAAAPVLVKFDDDAGSENDSLIYRLPITTTNNYFVQVAGYQMSVGTYDLGLYLQAPGLAPGMGGQVHTEAEPNDVASAATDASQSWQAVTLVARTAGQITASSDVDLYAYDFAAGDLLSVEIVASGNLDARMAIVNSVGNTLAIEDGSSFGLGGNSPLYAFRIPTTGRYYVKVYSDITAGSYTADVLLSTAMPPLPPVVGLDYYHISLTAGDSLSAGILGDTLNDLRIRIEDSAGAVLAQGTPGPTNFDQLIGNFTAPTSGNYYLRVIGNQGQSYTLLAARNAALSGEPNSSLSTAQSLPLAGLVLGSLLAGDEDFYSMSLSAGQAVLLTTTTPGGQPLQPTNVLDPRIELYDSNNTLVASDDNSAADGRNARLVYTPSATGTYKVRVLAAAGSGDYTLRAAISPAAQVVGRAVFYNNSKFDAGDPAAGAADDDAIATDKGPLLPGSAATLANYTSYSRGINGLMIDVVNLRQTPTAADFSFRIGNDDNPALWAAAPLPSSISVRSGAGVGGSDRITLIWSDGAIKNTWLQVVVKAGGAIGLSAADTFYFGNAVGETGNLPGDARVNATDEVLARTNGRSFLDEAQVDDLFDFNRDGLVNATDQILARANSTTLATRLKLISVPDDAELF